VLQRHLRAPPSLGRPIDRFDEITHLVENSSDLALPDSQTLRFRLIDLNRTPSAIAFCATAPRVRRSFFAT
jgi:hypothetical protein